RFGFGQDKVEVRVGALSGGEKARLLFALISREAPQILLLDEPTNHLDIDAREALIQALNDFSGAIVLVTHDPHLIELVADRLWLVADGRVRPFDGDLEDYRRLLMEQRRAERRRVRDAKPEGAAGAGKPASKKDKRRAAAEARAAVADLLALADQDETAPDCPDCEGCFGGSLAKAWLTPASVDQAWTVGRSATFPARDHPAAPPTVRGPPLGGRAPPFVRPI
ncbi:MAG: AAA family ATPase, partial [Caulobacterales bacterium]|nr:AAA family ATPase [Caulobacterales bacterium]